jgi:hypothetical protein
MPNRYTLVFQRVAAFYRNSWLHWTDATKRSPGMLPEQTAKLIELMNAGVKQRPGKGTQGRCRGAQNWSRPRNSIWRLAAPSTRLLIRPTLPGAEMFAAGR